MTCALQLFPAGVRYCMSPNDSSTKSARDDGQRSERKWIVLTESFRNVSAARQRGALPIPNATFLNSALILRIFSR
jgi:hypothetical protein